ncbi:MAG: helicase-related protein [Leptospiraceae bacterium]|nr:helicase-related protein [Leptospiraceae bacterium]
MKKDIAPLYIRDNLNNNSVGNFLKTHIQENAELRFLTAYFTLQAYSELQAELESIQKLYFLFGQPSFIQSIDPERTEKLNYQIFNETEGIAVTKALEQKALALACSEWIQKKVEIKSLVNNFLHGKLYHITKQTKEQEAILGSSNFTKSGLGFSKKPNLELNLVITQKEAKQELKEWFDKIWNDSANVKDVKGEVLAYLKKLYQDNSPEFIYLKTLYHVFQDWIQNQQDSIFFEDKVGFFETEIWNMLYDFQKDGVKAAINKIQKYNGCIIADSVGLGKTFEALAIIRYFELKNYRVLVVCPKRLKENWTIYQSSKNNILNPFKKDKFNYHILFHTDMGQEKGKSKADGHDFETFNWGAYDLLVIDESHNFRGNPMQKGSKLNRVGWLLEKVIKGGVNTKVLLLSATPVNNSLHDLRNQILLIARGEKDFFKNSLNIADVTHTIQKAQTSFTNWAKKKITNNNLKVEDLISQLEDGFFTLLDSLTIARSRKQIQEFYQFKQKFPTRLKPISIYPDIDLQKALPSYEKIEEIIRNYKLSLFQPFNYVYEEKKLKYIAQAEEKGFVKDTRSFKGDYLIGMMKVNFLKRLESSIHSFRVSMERTIQKIDELLTKIEKFQTSKQNEVLEQILVEEAEEEESDFIVGQKLQFELADLDLEKWKKDLQEDKKAIQTLFEKAKEISHKRDAKLDELKKIISEKVKNFSIHKTLINSGNRKLLIFTAFSDTAEYLYENLKDFVQKELGLHIALVTGTSCQTTFGKQDFGSILQNFSPISKNRQANIEEEIDVLIATDCISEGQNLQDCDTVINYDIHWNPVRIIQRFGRIDRIGSKNQNVMLVNFWPVDDLNKYINLKERVEARMALVDLTATANDNLLSPDFEDTIQTELNHRDKQLLRLKEEVLDLEEIDENPSMTDFNLDNFRQDLLNYLKSRERELLKSPLGMFAHVPSPIEGFSHLIDYSAIAEVYKQNTPSGVIFCLKRKDVPEKISLKNPLSPYFLVYVTRNGEIQFSYTKVKQILEIYRYLCLHVEKPFDELCNLFNQRTNNGNDVHEYNELLLKAIQNLNEKIQAVNLENLLQGGRETVLLPYSANFENLELYELITWLIVW